MGQPAIAEIVEQILEEKFEAYAARYLAGRERVVDLTGTTERLIRLEEELKAQRELMEDRFEAMDKRFEDLVHYMDKRFEAVDKRFEDLLHHMDQRFEDLIHYVDRRFSLLTWLIAGLFGALAVLITVFKFVQGTPSP